MVFIKRLQSMDLLIVKLQCNLEIVKSRIKNKDIEWWYSNVRKKTKLRTYVTFNVEQYLLNPIQKCQCYVFAKLRCGILPLHIKTGRYTSTALENHLCEFCDKNVTEDEKHFICSCSFYNDISIRNSIACSRKLITYNQSSNLCWLMIILCICYNTNNI